MKAILKQRCTVECYDQGKATQWLNDWIDTAKKDGWTCTKWGTPSYQEMFAQVEKTIEVDDNDEL